MLKLQHTNYHKRHHSWPPFKLPHHNVKNIDEDPFSFFISSDTDSAGSIVNQDYHMNADIDLAPRSRSHSPRMSHNRAKLLASPTGKSIIKLKKWVEKMEIRYFHMKRHQPLTPQSHSILPDITISDADAEQAPDISQSNLKRPASPDELERIEQAIPIPLSPPLRGRRTRRSSRRPYGNRMVRSHSKRARVWQEPDEELWPVMEEDEIGLGITV